MGCLGGSGTGGDGDTALFSGGGVGFGLGFTSTSLGAFGLPFVSVFGADGGTTSTVVLLLPAVSARAAVKPKASRPAAIIESRFMMLSPSPHPRC